MRIAIIGMGNMGSKYAKYIKEDSSFNMTLVAVTRPKRDKELFVSEYIKDVLVYDNDKEYINNNDKAKTCEAETELEDTAVNSLIIRLNKEQIEMTDTHYTELDSFRTELPDDLICYAIDAAVGNGVRKWVYVRRILQEYIQNSIKTVSEAKEHDEKRKQGYISHSTIPQKDRKPVSAARYEQREYDEKELEERLGVNDIFSGDWKGAS